jgi:DNA repair ATPase RecN
MTTFDVRVRNGKKGPGSTAVTVGTKDEADKVKDYLSNANPNSQVFVVEVPPVVVASADAWIENHKAGKVVDQKKAEVVARMSEEDRKILGL